MTKTDFLKKQFGFVFLPDLTEKAEFTFYELHTLLEDYEKAINYSPCCKSDSEQLLAVAKYVYWNYDESSSKKPEDYLKDFKSQ